ncbi:MAG TPA: FAD-dependent monooxygenase [Candidatus Eremiobacteraceae bacterium]|nr:FAD-dependent monooxygenase [Candidatus Eremiobacteraceae bacterium]
MKVIIIGGGIGGLTAANALHKVGIEAHVYERAPQIREVGAGISVWTNAIRVLDALGFGEEIRSHSLANAAGSIRNWRGEIISAVSIAQLEKQFGTAIAVVHRADLIEILLEELLSEQIHLGCELTNFSQNIDGATAHFANHEIAHGDVLIGADGLQSAVRSQLLNDGRPRYSGYTAWRAVVNFEPPNLEPSETWGPGRRFGIVPMACGRIYWFATQNAREGERDDPGQTKTRLRELFSGWHHPIESILEATEETAILRNDIYDRDPIPHWGRNRVTLLGDAAHPATPNLGQGGCLAIEDAAVLTACLATIANPDDALREYENRRFPRTKGIVLSSRRIGEIAQMENAFLSFLRNLAIRATPRSISNRQLNAVASFEALTENEKLLFSRK